MKYIRWIGGTALVGTVGVAALVVSAAVGDPTFIRRSDPTTKNFSGATKGCMAVWVATVWGGITPAALTALECSGISDETGVAVTCSAKDTNLYTAAEFVAAEEAGETAFDVCEIVPGSGEATCERTYGPTALSTAQESALGACIETAWAAADGDLLHEFIVWPGEGAVRSGSYQYHSTASPSDYLDLIDGDFIVKRTGTVAE